jgi:hypothetical protein
MPYGYPLTHIASWRAPGVVPVHPYGSRSPATLPGFGITSVYLQGIDSGEIIETVHARRAPTTPVSASLRL